MKGTWLTLVLLAPIGSLLSQVAPMKATPSCPQCVLQTIRVATLQFPAGLELQIPPIAVREDASKRIWVFEGALPRVFDDQGRFLMQVGREGGGPGEYRLASDLLLLPGDSVGVVDLPAGRVSVLDKSLRFVRAISLPMRLKSPVVHRWPDHVIMTGHAGTPGAAGWPLHVVSFRGSAALIVKSFGQGRGERRAGQLLDINHQLAPIDNGRFVSLEEVEYNGYIWTWDGRMVSSFSQRPAWFTARGNIGIGTPKLAPPSAVTAVWSDREARTWVATRSASRTWSTAWSGISPFARDAAAHAIEWDRLFESHIEAIDVRGHRVISSLTVPGWIIGMFNGPRIVRYMLDANGEVALVVDRITLKRDTP